MLDFFISKYIYKLQVIIRPFYVQLRGTVYIKWTPEIQQNFGRVKKDYVNSLTADYVSLSLTRKKHFIFYAMSLTMISATYFF